MNKIIYLVLISFLMLSIQLKAQVFYIDGADESNHHLQELGWEDSKVTIRLWILSVLFMVLALLTIKLR